jgi:hypothetical protein
VLYEKEAVHNNTRYHTVGVIANSVVDDISVIEVIYVRSTYGLDP